MLSAILRVLVVVVCLFPKTSSGQSLPDKQLFQESFAAAKTADSESQSYIFGEIAIAETARGYYGEASDAARLAQQNRDLMFTTLAAARAKRGDISGAKELAASAENQQLRWQAEQAIAFEQVNSGDLSGASETARHLPSPLKQNVLQWVGNEQAGKGELEAALRTATEMQSGWSDEVYYTLAVKLRAQGNKQKAHELAGRILDEDMRRAAEVDSIKPPAVEAPRACDLAVQHAKRGQLEKAYKLLQTEHCDCAFVVRVYAESRDVPGAEKAASKCSPNPSDVSNAMAGLSMKFAASGDISAALRFADAVGVPGAYQNGEGYLAPALREVAHAWAKRDGAEAVLGWARSRPTGYERAMALLGIAESIAPR
ncbi:MAG TPA: hypothetical protein VFI45_12655 [Candidatus Acidoferrum sp.]|nr:hypothetical protein [Candidatus Acidoferrum sp.]